jgi:hypothetical protein
VVKEGKKVVIHFHSWKFPRMEERVFGIRGNMWNDRAPGIENATKLKFSPQRRKGREDENDFWRIGERPILQKVSPGSGIGLSPGKYPQRTEGFLFAPGNSRDK